MGALLGLDVGTSGTRAVAVDAVGGRLLASASASYPLATPRPGWAEQDPADWARAAREVLSRVAADAGQEVLGLGLAGQMHGSVFLDSADRVIRPALLWNDQRTERAAAQIVDRVGAAELVARTGNPALTGFQAPKLLWLRDAEPEAYARLSALLLPKDYVRLVLTGERATDLSDASGTLLLDCERRRWSAEILDALEVDPAWLPTLHEGTEPAGRLRDDVAADLGLPAGLPVAAGGGDNAAAAVGVGVVAPGAPLSVSVGTSGVVFAPTPAFSPDASGRVHAFCHAVPGGYHAMAVILAAGASLTWWRDVNAPAGLDELVAESAAVPPGARGLVFLPYLSGERTPLLDARASAAFVGLGVRHGRAEMTRAVMEGVVLALRAGLDAMRDSGAGGHEVLAVGGGARSPAWRRLLADVLGLPVRRAQVDEGPAYGAALLAGVASGAYADVFEAIERVALRDEVTAPDPRVAALYDELSALHASLYAPLRDGMHALADFTGRWA